MFSIPQGHTERTLGSISACMIGLRTSGMAPSCIRNPSLTSVASAVVLKSRQADIVGPHGLADLEDVSLPMLLTSRSQLYANARRSPLPDSLWPRSGDVCRPCERERRRISVVPNAPAPRTTISFCEPRQYPSHLRPAFILTA